MLKRIFAALAGALALITVPPGAEVERQLPVVLDLSATVAPGPPPPAPTVDAITPAVALVWPQ